ncbi:MAG: molybdopterin molybdotransferase MoeA [Oscillochloris sp.]|nr:molybdopterin molybdotransferase MoeA [Oscillochloris sp.]
MSEMRRESPYPMLPVEVARATVMAYAAPLGLEEIDALSAEGRILATDITSPEDIPDVAKSAMDGYALRAADGLAARQVVAELTAGALPRLLIGPGEAARIMTGAPMPSGADAMIPVELTEERDGLLHIQRELRPGDNVHTIGQDIARSQLILAKGTRLSPVDLGLLATLGLTRVQAFRRPRVAVLATGDEVCEPGELRPLGAVRDSNRYALLAAAREAGCEAISLGIVRDDYEAQRAAILRGLDVADVLLTSGGVSMGTRDLVKPILAEIGTLHFGRVSFKPGKPTTFATVGSKLIFGLPGYPVSSLVSFEVFVRPVLRALQGDARAERIVVRAKLTMSITPPHDRPEYQRVTLSWRDGAIWAASTGGQGSSRLISLRGANGLLIVPPADTPYPVGSELEVMIMGEL